jgi:hypothetical protein
MGIFNLFRSEKQQKVAKVPVNVTFTAEETEAIGKNRGFFASLSPEGKELHVTTEAANAIDAIGLLEYVFNMVASSERAGISREEQLGILEKAVKAQAKVCALHDLPYYWFLFANLCAKNGQMDQAKRLYAVFLKTNREFKPGNMDVISINYLRENGLLHEEDAVAEAEEALNS